jgi:hypothetical protein
LTITVGEGRRQASVLVWLVLLSGGVSSLASAAGNSPVPKLIPNDGVSTLSSSGKTLYVGGAFSRFARPTGHVIVVNRRGRIDPTSPRVTGDFITAIAPDGKGGWFIAGRFDFVGAQRCSYVAHIRADETLDSGWCPNPNADVRSLALDGRTLYIGGFFDNIRGETRHLVAALDATTGAVLPWNPDASGTGSREGSPRVAAVAVSGATIYVGGVFDRVGGEPRRLLAALDARSGRATSWNPKVTGSCDYCGAVDDVAVSGRTVFVGGEFTKIGDESRRDLAGIDAGSGRATSFNPAPNREVLDLALLGSRLYVAGAFSTLAGTHRVGVAVVGTRTGRLLPWNARLGGYRPAVWAVAPTATIVYVGGEFDTIGSLRRNGLAAVDARSGRASAWNPDPAQQPTSALALAGDRIVVGGWFGSVSAGARAGFASLDTSAWKLTGWRPVSDGSSDRRLLATDSAVYLSGDFSHVNGKVRHGFAALDPRTGALRSWDPAAVIPDPCCCCDGPIAAAGSTIYVAGYFSRIGGRPRENLAALDASTGQATSWNPQPNDAPLAITPAGPRVYVGGNFSRIASIGRASIAAINARTGQATPWNPGADDAVRAIAVVGQRIYVAGDFFHIGGAKRRGLAAIDAVTGKALSWDPAPLYSGDPNQIVVRVLLTVGSTVIVGGDFDRVSGLPRDRLAAIDGITGKVLPWKPQLSGHGVVTSLLRVGDTLFVGGYMDAYLLAYRIADVTRSG